MQEKISLQTKSGDELSAVIHRPSVPIAALTLAHGAGAGMNHPFLISLANALCDYGVACLRFNFLYMEQKKRRPDFPAVAHQAVAAALQRMHELYPTQPLFASGKSFGGRMSSQYLASTSIEVVRGIIFFGFPLHTAGKPSTDRAAHLATTNLPMLFVQGTKDELARWDLLQEVLRTLPAAHLCTFEGADHSFKKGKENLIPLIAEETVKWINEQVIKI